MSAKAGALSSQGPGQESKDTRPQVSTGVAGTWEDVFNISSVPCIPTRAQGYPDPRAPESFRKPEVQPVCEI